MKNETVVTVTKKGQATIPKQLREKHRIGRKVLVLDTTEGVLLKPVPDPSIEKGSLRIFFKGKTSRDLINNAREPELRQEEKFAHRGRRGK